MPAIVILRIGVGAKSLHFGRISLCSGLLILATLLTPAPVGSTPDLRDVQFASKRDWTRLRGLALLVADRRPRRADHLCGGRVTKLLTQAIRGRLIRNGELSSQCAAHGRQVP